MSGGLLLRGFSRSIVIRLNSRRGPGIYSQEEESKNWAQEFRYRREMGAIAVYSEMIKGSARSNPPPPPLFTRRHTLTLNRALPQPAVFFLPCYLI
jgi:hypothetical protein